MTPELLRDLLERTGMTQARAAGLAGVKLRTMQQYLAGDRTMPLSASGLLALGCIFLGSPPGLLLRFLPPDLAEAVERDYGAALGDEAAAAAAEC